MIGYDVWVVQFLEKTNLENLSVIMSKHKRKTATNLA